MFSIRRRRSPKEVKDIAPLTTYLSPAPPLLQLHPLSRDRFGAQHPAAIGHRLSVFSMITCMSPLCLALHTVVCVASGVGCDTNSSQIVVSVESGLVVEG